MGFKAAGQTKPGGQLVRLAEKIDLLRQRPAIVARQQIDKARVEAAGLGEAGLQARQMLLGRFMLGGEHPPPLKEWRYTPAPTPAGGRRAAAARPPLTARGLRYRSRHAAVHPAFAAGSSLPRGCEHFSSMAASSGVLHAGQDAEHLVQQVGRQLGGITAHVVGARPRPDRRQSDSGRGSRGRSPAPEWRSDRQLPASRFGAQMGSRLSISKLRYTGPSPICWRTSAISGASEYASTAPPAPGESPSTPHWKSPAA